MHIPDGYLDPSIATITYLLSIAYLAYSLHKLSSESEKLSAITVFAATIFVAQMINWPIPGGTSLHFLGGALVGIVLGPWVGSVTMFLVLLVQCLIFHDGDITALWANTLNMAIVAVVSGYLIYRSTRRRMGGMLASQAS